MLELPRPGDRILNKYVLGPVLGRGGMGVVFEAVHERMAQSVAIKFLRPELVVDKGTVARFEREAVAAGQTQNEHVVRVFDVDKTPGGLPFIVMERLDGRELSVELKEREPPLEQLIDWMLQVCLGIGEAHARGVVHRDLKPSNVFLSGPSKTAKVLDFGVSKLIGTEHDLTATATLIGTPRYMAPEQIDGAHRVDGRADIWSLGVVLYRALSGDFPFSGGTNTAPVATAIAILRKPAKHLREVAPNIPSALADAVMAALQKDPAKRPPNAIAFADLLAPFGSGRVVIPPTLSRVGVPSPLDSDPSLERAASLISRPDDDPTEPAEPTAATRIEAKADVARAVLSGPIEDGSLVTSETRIAAALTPAPIPPPRDRSSARQWAAAVVLVLVGVGSAVAWQWRANRAHVAPGDRAGATAHPSPPEEVVEPPSKPTAPAATNAQANDAGISESTDAKASSTKPAPKKRPRVHKPTTHPKTPAAPPKSPKATPPKSTAGDTPLFL